MISFEANEKIKMVITNAIDLLKEDKYKNLSEKYIETINVGINKLESIQFSSINDIRSVKCFIEVRNYFFNVNNIISFSKVFDSMEKCLPNIPEKKFYHAIVECALNEIRKKASELEKRNFLTIAKNAIT